MIKNHLLIPLIPLVFFTGIDAQFNKKLPFEMMKEMNSMYHFYTQNDSLNLGLKSSDYQDYMFKYFLYNYYTNIDSIISSVPPVDLDNPGELEPLSFTELGLGTSESHLNRNLSQVFYFHNNHQNIPDSVTHHFGSCGSRSEALSTIYYTRNERGDLNQQVGVHRTGFSKIYSPLDTCVNINPFWDKITIMFYDTISIYYKNNSFINEIHRKRVYSVFHTSRRIFFHYSFDSVKNKLTRIDSISSDYFTGRYKNEVVFNNKNRVDTYNHYIYDSLKSDWAHYYKVNYLYPTSDTLNYIKTISVFLNGTWNGIEKEVSEYDGGREWIKKYYLINDLEWKLYRTSTFYLSNPLPLSTRGNMTKNLDSKINVYPNPCTSGLLNIEVPGELHLVEMAIYTLSGKLLQKQPVEKADCRIQMDISDLPTGLYLIKCKAGTGKVFYNKFISHK